MPLHGGTLECIRDINHHSHTIDNYYFSHCTDDLPMTL